MHDGTPVPKVIDFGIAKATNQRLTEKTLFTRYAHVIGTPAYLAPEAFVSSNKIDQSIDIYALACMAYWMTSKNTLFASENAIGYFSKHMKTEPPRLGEFIHETQIPEDFENLLLRCLSKQASQRPSSREFLLELIKLEEAHPWNYLDASNWWANHGFD